jgi:uncharacterized membrane protein
MKLIRTAIAFVLVVTAVMTFVMYPVMPDPVPSHWNAAGQVDGHLPKFWGLILIPLLMYGFCVLFVVLPRIDPLRKNYLKFQSYYERFIFALAVFFSVIQLQIILWGMGMQVSPNLTMPVMIGILFICIGFLTEHAEPNWFVGIRTPWTLSSERVWKKTHERGGTLFKLAGVVSMIGTFAGIHAWLVIIAPVLAVAVYSVVYSYIEFNREQAADRSR